MQAMIFAAGLGTRLKPLTDHMPKALVPVNGKPLLWHVLMKLHEAGCGRIVINVHHFAEQIKDYLKANDNFGLDIRISDETEKLLDTGGGLRKAAPLFNPDEPVLVHNVDILSDADLAAFYADAASTEGSASLLVSSRKTSRYLIFDRDWWLRAWTNVKTGEVKSPDELLRIHDSAFFFLEKEWQARAFSGIHVISQGMLREMASWPDRFPIMDFYLDHARKGEIRGFDNKELHLLDVGKLDTLDEAAEFESKYKIR